MATHRAKLDYNNMKRFVQMNGSNIAGAAGSRGRAADDFYATPEYAVREILKREELDGSIWEPACGQGHISRFLKEKYPFSAVWSTDLVQREDVFSCGVVGGVDFLNTSGIVYDNVITNPPFSLAKEFIEKALSVTRKKVIIFAKLALLEGASRKEMFDRTPLKTVYVFSKRVSPMRNGSELDENGKPWSSTMAFAWFVWDKGYSGKPTIEWI